MLYRVIPKVWIITGLGLSCLWVTLAWPMGTITRIPLNQTAQGLAETEYADLIKASMTNNLDAQIQFYERAAEKAPTNLIALYNAAVSHYAKAQSPVLEPDVQEHCRLQAERYFQRVQSLNPDLILSYFKLGKLALLRHDLDAAKAYYQEGLAVDPENASLAFNLGEVLEQQNLLPQAIVQYQHALALDPKFIYAYNNLGLIYERTQEFKEAENTYIKALAIHPGYVHARLNLGALYESQGLKDAARLQYETVLKIDPNNAWASFYLGGMAFRSGQFEDALQFFQSALSQNPRFPVGYYYLAMTLVKLNRMDEAMSAGLTYLDQDASGQFAAEMATLVREGNVRKASNLKDH